MNLSNNNVRIGIVVALVLLAGAGYYYFLSSAKPASPAQSEQAQEETVLTLKSEDLGLTLTPRSDKRAVKFVIAKATDVKSVEYEVTYKAEGDIPRGAIGTVESKNGGSMESNYIDLGTCSANKCKYDVVISPVKLVLKITKTDGKIYQTETSLIL